MDQPPKSLGQAFEIPERKDQGRVNVRHARLSWVAQTELRSLPSSGREPIVAKRRRLEGIVGRIIADGVDEGAFLVADPAAVSRALLSLCAAIPTWCEPLGDKTSRRVAHTYRELAARMTGQRVAPSARPVQQGRRAAARAAA